MRFTHGVMTSHMSGGVKSMSTKVNTVLMGESDLPACGPPASFSVHLASSAQIQG